MIKQSIIDQYISESESQNKEETKQNLATRLKCFFYLKSEVEYNDLTREDLIEMFSILNVMSINSFLTYKSKINKFMEWMHEKGYGSDRLIKDLSEIQYNDISRSSSFDIYYFKSFDDLFSTLETVFKDRGTEFDTFKCAAILVWFGIEICYLPEILKTDYDDNSRTINHPVTGEKITLPYAAASLLLGYKNAVSQDSRKFGGKVLNYQKTRYLFRSYKNPHFTLNQLRNISSSANRVAEDHGKIFQWGKIYLSGLYNRIYEYEQNHGEIGRSNYEMLEKFFGDDKGKTTRRKISLARDYDQYQEFKQNMLI